MPITDRPPHSRNAIVLVLAGLSALAAPANAAGLSPVPLLPETPYSYAGAALPAHSTGLARLDSTPDGNRVTDHGATLGRVLFYDRGLSANGLVSCSSCHAQTSGFDDPTRFSIGFTGKITRRSAMALGNARFNPRGRYFRDERAASLEEQVLVPFTDEIEMGLKPGQLVRRIAARDWYAPLFRAAFGDAEINEDRVARALAQFVRAMVTAGSRYDSARRSNPDRLADFPQFTAAENRGKFLFMASRQAGGAGCTACHQTDAFVMTEPRDNGLPPLPGRSDGGVGEGTGRQEDLGKFRAPSLKNIAASAPYMRDGRFATLEEVIAHYSDSIARTPNLSPLLRDAGGEPVRFAFPLKDRQALLAFLETLTDEFFLSDPRFASPFRVDGQ